MLHNIVYALLVKAVLLRVYRHGIAAWNNCEGFQILRDIEYGADSLHSFL